MSVVFKTLKLFLFSIQLYDDIQTLGATVTMFNLFLPLEVIRNTGHKIGVLKPREFLML